MRKFHGYTYSPTWNSWRAMKARCFNKNNIGYKDYGAKGITVEKSWMRFANFLKDMGERPFGHTLDRIDPRGNYCKENCKWSTVVEQSRNKTSCIILSYNGISATVSEWAEKLGIGAETIRARLKRGWSVERTLGSRLQVEKRNKITNRSVEDKSDVSVRSLKSWRTKVLVRDNYRCKKCTGDKNLQVHHILPRREFPNKMFFIDNGIALCKACHQKLHLKELMFASEMFDTIRNYEYYYLWSSCGNGTVYAKNVVKAEDL